jgi:pimeloyl-ACP methyl ester carboxylesterase
METNAVAVPEISTTGRLNPLPIPLWLRTSFKVTASVAPGLAAAWADRVFFTPRRAAVRPKEAEVLATAERFELRVAGRKVRGWAWGGAGAPVLLVHGWGGHTGQMTVLASALMAAGHRVMGMDMPGHGESEGNKSSLIYFEQALHAAATLFGSFAGVIAHSFGCAGATLALSRSFPAERVVFFAPPVSFQMFWDRFCDGLGVPAPVWERVIANSQKRWGILWSETNPAVLAPRMSVPLCILHDRNDAEISHQDGAELAKLWPGAEFVTTAGLGHNRILREASAVAKAVEFIGCPQALRA